MPRRTAPILFTYILLIAIIASQVIPTFGGYIGFTGNIIPFAIALSICIISATILLCQNFGVNKGSRSTSILLILYFFFMPTLILIGSILSPLTTLPYDIIIELAHFVSIGILVYLGHIAYCHLGFNYKHILSILFFGYLLNLILFVNFKTYGYELLLPIYSTREMGHIRFQGSWNYPYNVSVFLFSTIAVALYLFKQTPIRAYKFLLLLVCGSSLVMLINTQARIALVALMGTLLITVSVTVTKTLRKNRWKISNAIKTLLLLPLALVLISIIFINYIPSLEEDFRYLFSLFDSTAFARAEAARGNQASRGLQFMLDHPWTLLTGIGASRAGDLWIESAAIYFYRYGLIGGILIYVVPLLHLLWLSAKNYLGKANSSQPFSGMLFFIMIFIIINSLTNNLILHYRFLPLFFFLYGWLIAYYDRQTYTTRKDQYRSKRFPQNQAQAKSY